MKLVFKVMPFLALGFLLSGCLPLNLLEQGPGGMFAVVLNQEGAYEPLLSGGALWLLDPDGKPQRKLLELAEEQSAGEISWAPSGEELSLTVVQVGEYGFPEEWRIVRVPLEGEPVDIVSHEYPLISPHYTQTGSAILYLAIPEEEPALYRFDLVTGEEQLLANNVLAFLLSQDKVYLLDTDGAVRVLGEEDVLAEVRCPEEYCQGSLLFWPRPFLALDPTGRYFAISLQGEPGVSPRRRTPCPACTLSTWREGRPGTWPLRRGHPPSPRTGGSSRSPPGRSRRCARPSSTILRPRPWSPWREARAWSFSAGVRAAWSRWWSSQTRRTDSSAGRKRAGRSSSSEAAKRAPDLIRCLDHNPDHVLHPERPSGIRPVLGVRYVPVLGEDRDAGTVLPSGRFNPVKRVGQNHWVVGVV